MDNIYNGIVLYQIDAYGHLKGVHTNEFLDGTVNVEIAEKQFAKSKIIGVYHSTFFKRQTQMQNVRLDVSVKNDKKKLSIFYGHKTKNPSTKALAIC
jgi:hypothetical protein